MNEVRRQSSSYVHESLFSDVRHRKGYGYDLAGRLITVHENTVLVSSFTFDQNGNRTTIQDRGASFAATTDAQDRLVTYGSLSFQYQDSGEVALRTDTSTGESASFTYDDRGNLRAAALPDQCNLSYKADAKDRRVTKSYNGQLEEQYLYEDQLRITAKLNADGEITQRYVYATLAHTPDLIRTANAEYRVLHDHLGSPRVIVNTQSGEIVRVMRHDAWGRILADTNPGFSPHGFAGGLADQDTKLVRFGARDYSPELGRWVARDPIGFEGGDTNLYGYVMQDPVNAVDPSGEVEINLFNRADEPLFSSADSQTTPSGEFWIAAHGGKGRFLEADGSKGDIKNLANRILNHPSYDPRKTIRLLICNSATPSDSEASVAQQLANTLNREIIGAESLVFIPNSKTGRPFVHDAVPIRAGPRIRYDTSNSAPRLWKRVQPEAK